MILPQVYPVVDRYSVLRSEDISITAIPPLIDSARIEGR
jgi:hypothetical protein